MEIPEALDDYFIIKEINIDCLMQKYQSNTHPQTSNDTSLNPNITPYDKGRGLNKIFTQRHKDTKEEYYRKKLCDLIEGEIEVLSVLQHDNIIRFSGCTRNMSVYSLKMEYCNLGDVHVLLKNKPDYIQPDFVVEFVKQTSRSLMYIHDLNIIHRDVKLQNILMHKRDKSLIVNFKLSDFGFACADLTSTPNANTNSEMLRKKYYKLCGTPYYMAPEIVLNMQYLDNFEKHLSKPVCKPFYSKAVDMWSFGICVYELVLNSLPFPHIRSVGELEKFFKGTPQAYIENKMSKHDWHSTPDMLHLLRMLLQVDPTKRATAHQVHDFINSHLVDTTATSFDHRAETHQNDSGGLSESWEKINKSSSLFRKMSVQRGFLKWLMNLN
jgi:serine/threonine protein kinase